MGEMQVGCVKGHKQIHHGYALNRLVHCFLLTLVMGLSVCGCSPHTRSKLAGEWRYVEGQRVEIEPDGTQNTSVLQAQKAAPDVVIRADGSFDWSHTLGVFVLSIDKLRRPGDRIEIIQRHDLEKQVRGYAELARSSCEPEASEAVIRIYDIQGKLQQEYVYRVELAPGGKVRYRCEAIMSDGARIVEVASLRPVSGTESQPNQ